MIPVNFMRRMNTFKLEIDGVEIQAKFVEEETLLDEGLEQLLEILESTKYPILGFDIKSPMLLVLHVKNICLLVPLDRTFVYPLLFTRLFTGGNICCLGIEISKKYQILDQEYSSCYSLLEEEGVDIRTFPAKALHNRDLLEGCSTLEELARKVGFPELAVVASEIGNSSGMNMNESSWDSMDLTAQKIKYAVLGAYTLGTKIMAEP